MGGKSKATVSPFSRATTRSALRRTKRAELEWLHGAPRRCVVVSPRVDQIEVGPQNCRQRGCIVSHNRYSAALLGAVQGKRSDDGPAFGLNGFLEPRDIGGLI